MVTHRRPSQHYHLKVQKITLINLILFTVCKRKPKLLFQTLSQNTSGVKSTMKISKGRFFAFLKKI